MELFKNLLTASLMVATFMAITLSQILSKGFWKSVIAFAIALFLRLIKRII